MRKNEIEYTDNVINIYGCVVECEAPIRDVQRIDNLVLVRLEFPIGAINNRNIFAYNESGQLVWQIQEGRNVYRDSPYTGMRVKGDEIMAYNWDGADYRVNVEDGSVEFVQFSR